MSAAKRVQEIALASIVAERARQDEKWGVQDHDPFKWNAILMEEVGEWMKEALELRSETVLERAVRMRVRMRAEAVQVAAVALAMVECIDRGTWEWGQ